MRNKESADMRFVRAFLAAVVVILVIAPAAALAQGPLNLTTPFPSVVADPGATAQFTITVHTDVPERVDLSVVGQPTGWDTILRGGGSTIAAVTTSANPDVPTEIIGQFTAEVAIPEDSGAGANQVVIEARSAALTSRLTLDITIEEVVGGAVTMTSDFPSRSGSADDTFSFDLEVRNGSNQQVTLSFEGEGPAGWRVQARPSADDQATTAVVDAGGISSARVTIDPPADAAAGSYPITVRALGGPEPVEVTLTVEVTGSFGMSIATEDQRLSARTTVGSPTKLNVVVTNDGSAALQNVTLASTPPRNWTITFASPTIAEILPGASQTVEATITAANNAVAGDYVITIRATAPEANDSMEIRTTVETSPIGGLLGIGVLVVVAVGLFFVFQRYGRR